MSQSRKSRVLRVARAMWRDCAIAAICPSSTQSEEGRTVTRGQSEENLAGKRIDPDFRDDVGPLLRPGFSWDFEAALDAVLQRLVALLAGEPWKGAGDEDARARVKDAEPRADPPAWSARVGIGHRALCVRDGDDVVWFWIGSHADDDRLVESLESPQTRTAE